MLVKALLVKLETRSLNTTAERSGRGGQYFHLFGEGGYGSIDSLSLALEGRPPSIDVAESVW